jgi:protein involved in polysaccharide export with SLBB domain
MTGWTGFQGGDVLYVPQKKTEVFFVVGDVIRSGALTMPEAEKVLVSRALSMAGGVLKTAKMSKGMLVRTDAHGNREELHLDFAAILRGKQPDFPIQPNDVIYIPGSTTKSIGYGLIGAIPNVATDAATVR